MELFFIRHGQGEHNLDIPDRLNLEHPHLTDKGIKQVKALKEEVKFHEDDVFIVSPTVRTIQTVRILTTGLKSPLLYVSPAVGPRVFPLKTDSHTVKCDITLPINKILEKYSEFTILNKDDLRLWDESINIISDVEFQKIGCRMIQWIQEFKQPRAYIIAHDGTITNYRRLLGEQGLTRAHFLGEAGLYKVVL